jgi:hypothetical protein
MLCRAVSCGVVLCIAARRFGCAGDNVLDPLLAGLTWLDAALLLLVLAALAARDADEQASGGAVGGGVGTFLQLLVPWAHLPLLAAPLYLLFDVVTWAREAVNASFRSAIDLARQSGGVGVEWGHIILAPLVIVVAPTPPLHGPPPTTHARGVDGWAAAPSLLLLEPSPLLLICSAAVCSACC